MSYWIPFKRYPPSLADSAVKLQMNTSAMYFEMQCKCHMRACLSTVSRKAPPQKTEAVIGSLLLNSFHTLSSRNRNAIQPRRKERSSAQYKYMYMYTCMYIYVFVAMTMLFIRSECTVYGCRQMSRRISLSARWTALKSLRAMQSSTKPLCPSSMAW